MEPRAWPQTLPSQIAGTGIARSGRAALIVGASGSGKSSLAFQMMSLGAGLISDDLCWLEETRGSGGPPILSRPPQVSGPVQIEARGIGIMDAAPHTPAPLSLIIDLSETERERLPERAFVTIAGHSVRKVARTENPAFASMVMHLLAWPA